MTIKVGDRVTWRPGGAIKPNHKGSYPIGFANCKVKKLLRAVDEENKEVDCALLTAVYLGDQPVIVPLADIYIEGAA